MKRKINGDTIYVADGADNTVLTIKVAIADDIATLTVSGSMTHDAAPEFEDELMSILTTGRDVVVDFASLDHISAPALKTLLSVQRLVDDNQYKFYIQNISDSVKETFEQTGFIDMIEIR